MTEPLGSWPIHITVIKLFLFHFIHFFEFNESLISFRVFLVKEDAATFMACYPHYKFFNDPRIVSAEQVMLETPHEEKAEWVQFNCRFETVDDFHRKGVSLEIENDSSPFPLATKY